MKRIQYLTILMILLSILLLGFCSDSDSSSTPSNSYTYKIYFDNSFTSPGYVLPFKVYVNGNEIGSITAYSTSSPCTETASSAKMLITKVTGDTVTVKLIDKNGLSKEWNLDSLQTDTCCEFSYSGHMCLGSSMW